MSEEELLRKNNVLMSHGNLPCDTTTCETYGLSGNCGKNCPNFKNKTCDVYVDVLERINKELQQENQELKKQLKELEEQSSNAINKQVARGIVLINQQKEFINYLKSMLENEKDNFSVARVKDVLSKYKKIIGEKK